jgi:hypothetical protein
LNVRGESLVESELEAVIIKGGGYSHSESTGARYSDDVMRKPKPISPGECGYGVRSRGSVRGFRNVSMEFTRKPKLKGHEIEILSWVTLVFSLMTGISILGTYFSNFVDIPGSEMMMLVGVMGFMSVHLLVVITQLVNECTLKFSRWSLGIIWWSVGLVFLLKVIELL